MFEVNDLIGVPYKDYGRTLEGLDCYGLAIEASRRAGYKLNDVFYNNHDLALSKALKPTLNIHRIDSPKEGALLEMEVLINGKKELHLGVCINKREFIHMTVMGCRINLIGTLKIRAIYGINTRI